jgi:hypothetical protein
MASGLTKPALLEPYVKVPAARFSYRQLPYDAIDNGTLASILTLGSPESGSL